MENSFVLLTPLTLIGILMGVGFTVVAFFLDAIHETLQKILDELKKEQ